MSVSGISSSNLFNYTSQGTAQQIQQEAAQLSQDLQAGDYSAAQADYVTLEQMGQPVNSTSSTQSSHPIAQEFNQLAQDLQSGNLAAAQQDYATLQQDFRNQVGAHHHHHHGGGGGSSEIKQLFDQLGQALQSGNLSNAQQAYSTLQQAFEQWRQTEGTSTQTGTTTSSQPTNTSVSVNA